MSLKHSPSPNPAAAREPLPWRFVIPHTLWDSALSMLVEVPEAWAVGPWRKNVTTAAGELLVDGLQVTRNPRAGTDRSPGECWYCFRLIPNLNAETFAKVLRECDPHPSQAVVVLAIDPGTELRWSAALLGQGKVIPIAEILVTGASPFRLSMHPEPLVLAEELRWSRTQGVLGDNTLHWLRQATITQVGAGRLGTMLAWVWASLGIRRLRVIDPDTLYLHNLDAMPGLNARMEGHSKVESLAKELREYRPDMELSLLKNPAEGRDSQAFLNERCDLLVTTVDNDLPRLVISRLARKNLIPHLDVATQIIRTGESTSQRYLADARLLLPGSGCVRCVGGLLNQEDLYYRLNAPRWALQLQKPPAWWEQRAGSLLSWNMPIAGTAAQMWLDLIGGARRASFWQRMEWTVNEGLSVQAGPIGRGTDCPLCLGREL